MSRIIITALALILACTSLQAEVRFGKNVRVGGHDFSNRTFTRDRNAIIHLYDRKPRKEGCRWVIRRDAKGRPTGKKTQVCHLQTKSKAKSNRRR